MKLTRENATHLINAYKDHQKKKGVANTPTFTEFVAHYKESSKHK